MGYVKPNAGLSELINTAKGETSKLTRRDTLIIIGGSNDIDKNVHGKNLTSIVNLLQDTQHTNVILVEVPVRYDIEARARINEQIESYNRKLQKVTKGFQHAKLIKVSSNRDQFTKHGLHLNNKGKELLAKELLKNRSVKLKSQKVDAIQLPWKEEFLKEGTQITEKISSSEILNTNTNHHSLETSVIVMKESTLDQPNPSLINSPTNEQGILNTITSGHTMEPAVPVVKESTSDPSWTATPSSKQ
jgi:hypothetical protein